MPQTFKLHGITAHVLNPKQLLEEKEVYKQIGRTPRQIERMLFLGFLRNSL
jgi:hypothetical protein